MGIQVEYNPDLALRNLQESEEGRRKPEECIPPVLEEGKTYEFLKSGQRNFYIQGEIPLVETDGNQVLSRPKASIIILEATHVLIDGKLFTKGRYKVIENLSKTNSIKFEGFTKIN